MALVYQTSFLHLHHDPAGATLETEWLGFVNSEQLRSSLLEALRLARQLGIKGWVANNLLLRAIRPADQDWLNHIWFPDFAKLGVERLAVIISQDGLNRMGIDNVLQRATEHLPFDTQHFADAQDARRWTASSSTLAATLQ